MPNVHTKFVFENGGPSRGFGSKLIVILESFPMVEEHNGVCLLKKMKKTNHKIPIIPP
jgi:hypothetical protein